MNFTVSHSSFRTWATTKMPVPQAFSLLFFLSAASVAAWLPSPKHPLHLLSQRQESQRFSTNSTLSSTALSPVFDKPSFHTASHSFVPAVAPNVWVVTSVADTPDGKVGDGICQTSSANGAVCTLRAAIAESNASGGGTINFNISGSGVKKISLLEKLPDIAQPVTINGFSQLGTSANTNATGAINAVPLIQILGNGGSGSNLTLATGSNGSQLRGLILSGAGDSGVEIASPNNIVAGCFIGTNPNGTEAQSNSFSGVRVSSFRNNPGDPAPLGNTIGGPNAADRNLISGNGTTPAILVQTSDANNLTIRNNLIGLNKSGTAALSNASDGVQLSSFNGIVSGNVISGNRRGVVITPADTTDEGAFSNTVEKNFIGTNATGTASIPNLREGVVVTAASLSDGSPPTTSNQLTGNVISGNAAGGVRIQGATTAYTTLRNNRIGVAANGTSPLGNTGGAGVTLDYGTSNNYIGGTSGGEGNIIANNIERGVLATSQAGRENAILGNSIYGNTNIGIDLNTDGVSKNDVGDADAGANNTQNYPVITGINGNTISGTLNSLANTNFRIELFSSLTTDPLGYGEGQTFLGFVSVKTNGSGNVNFSFTGTALGGLFISATATRQTNIPVETSEFSQAMKAVSSACSTTVANTNDNGTGSLRAAVDCANSNVDASTITFASGVSGAITLNTALPSLSTPLTITGPGSSSLTVQRSTATSTPLFRIFTVSNGTLRGPSVNISGLSIKAGKVTGDTIEDNYGGGIFNDRGTLSVSNCVLSGNSAIFGGGIYSYGTNGNATLAVSGCTFDSNHAIAYTSSENGGDAGAIYNDGGSFGNSISGGQATATISNTAFSNNTAAGYGGALYAYGESEGDVTTNISRCTFTNNNALISAGGIYNDGEAGQATMSIEDSTLSSNSSPGASSPTYGGGICNDGQFGGNATLTISGSTLANNNARFGGAIANIGHGSVATLTLSNSTLSGNSTSFYGAALYNDGYQSLANKTKATFTNVTVTGNFTSSNVSGYGSIYSYGPGSNISTSNSIYSAGKSGANFAVSSNGSITSLDYNLSSDSNDYLIQSHDRQNRDPKLAPLANNGGQTQTAALLADSPAIDAGSTSLTVDQRGVVRPQGNSDDIGAYEFQTTAPVKVNTSTVLVSSLNPSTVGQSVSFTATIKPASGTAKPTGTVIFKNGTEILGTVALSNDGTARISTSALAAGTYRLTANYSGDTQFNANISSEITQVVNQTNTVSISINDVSVVEGNIGSRQALFTVTLTGTPSSVATVNYATSNGTATAGSDYRTTSGTLTFANVNSQGIASSSIERTISVPIIGDTIREPNETFFVTLSNPNNATLDKDKGIGTIENDDLLADLSVTQTASASSIRTSGEVVFTITVKNNGPDTSQNVTLSENLPSGITILSSNPAPTSQSGMSLQYNLGTLLNGDTRSITLHVKAGDTVGNLSSDATVAGSGASDPTTPNNRASLSIPVTNGTAAFGFSIGKLINVGAYTPSLYRPGARFTQDVTITNTGTTAVSSLLLLLLNGLPSSVTLTNASGSQTTGTPYIKVPLPSGTLAAGKSVKVRLQFQLKKSVKPTFTPLIAANSSKK